MLAIEAQRHTGARVRNRVVPLRRDIPHQIPVEIRGKEIAEDKMGEGRSEMIGVLDAGNRMRGQLVGQIRGNSLRKCHHKDTSPCSSTRSSPALRLKRGTSDHYSAVG